MGQIYGQAERVVCWLGPSLDCDGGARYAFDAFDASNKLHAWEQQWGNSSTDEEWVLAFQNEVEDRDRLANELLGIMRRPWFSRIWTVQEAVLATSDPLMVLGGLVAPARALSIGMTMLMLHNQETRLIHASHAYSGLRIIDIMRAAERRRPRDDSDRTMSAFAQGLYRAISLTASSYACTVPHDMIYGLLGLACPPLHLPDRLTPAYDISFQDSYREYTRFLIEAAGELVVLEKCLGNFPDQPSWVADFRQQIPLFLSISTQTSPSPLVSFTHAGRRLTVQGTVSGKVLMVHSSQPDLFTVSTKSLINSVEAIASKSCSITHEALDNYLAQTLLSSCRDSLGVDMKTLKQVYNLLGGVNRFDIGSEYGTLSEAVVGAVDRRLRRELSLPWLVADNGSVFRVPHVATVKPGDLHCRFLASCSNYLVRPVQGGYLLLSASAKRMDDVGGAFDRSELVESFTIM